MFFISDLVICLLQEFHLCHGAELEQFQFSNSSVLSQATISTAEVQRFNLDSSQLNGPKFITNFKANSNIEQSEDVLSLDPKERAKLEENDEENDAKLFWDVVNSVHQWQEHKQKQEELKTLGGLTR
jgi:hypothetical protein